MGNFLACTALRDHNIADTTSAISQYMSQHGVSHEVLPGDTEMRVDTDAQVFPPMNGWVVVLWPPYFNIHDAPLARAVAANSGGLISSIHIYDDTYWEHFAVSGALELHSYCSRPNFWQEAGATDLPARQLSPDPARLAAALNVLAEPLQRYLVDMDELADESAKADASDEFALGDCWVFTDFWRRLGIVYPDVAGTEPAAIIRLSRWFAKKLPAAE